MVVYVKTFSRALDKKFCLNLKKILKDNHFKLFMDQSELSSLACSHIFISTTKLASDDSRE